MDSHAAFIAQAVAAEPGGQSMERWQSELGLLKTNIPRLQARAKARRSGHTASALDLSTTALRETYEEIGLPAAQTRLLGCLPQSHTRAGTPVTPFVATFDASFPLYPALAELDSIFTVPLADFHRGIQVRIDRFERQGQVFEAPAYHYQGYEIWGFTGAITAQLLRLLATEIEA